MGTSTSFSVRRGRRPTLAYTALFAKPFTAPLRRVSRLRVTKTGIIRITHPKTCIGGHPPTTCRTLYGMAHTEIPEKRTVREATNSRKTEGVQSAPGYTPAGRWSALGSPGLPPMTLVTEQNTRAECSDAGVTGAGRP